MTFWIVSAVVVIVILALMAAHDIRAKARGARLNPDAGRTSGQRGTNGTGNPDAYQGSDGRGLSEY